MGPENIEDHRSNFGLKPKGLTASNAVRAALRFKFVLNIQILLSCRNTLLKVLFGEITFWSLCSWETNLLSCKTKSSGLLSVCERKFVINLVAEISSSV